MKRLSYLLTACTLFVLLLSGREAGAQATTGLIVGRITDSSGAVIPGTSIVARDEDRGVSFIGRSDAAGNYVVLNVTPGVYTVTASSKGFAESIRSHAVLVIDQKLVLDFSLVPGTVATTVDVSEMPPLLQTQSAEVGTVISGKSIVDLPLLGRNFYGLTNLVPGVNGASGGMNAFNLSVSGQREYANSIQLDGIESTTNRTQDITATPNVDSVEEFKVVTAAYNAEFGNASGGVITIQTKAGSNSFHGSAYEFFRPNFMTARQTIPGVSSPQPASSLKQHNFGGTLGGPIKKGRAFFFVAYEGTRQKSAFSDVTSTIPFGLFSIKPNGDVDFSKLVDPCAGMACTKNGKPSGPPAGTVDPIFDPNVTVANYGWWSSQFPNNVIPASRVSKAGMNTLLNFFPKPNLAGIDNGWFRNYQAWAPTSYNSDQADARFDQVITSKDRLYAVYHWQGGNILDGDQFHGNTPVAGAGDADQANKEDMGVQTLSLTYDHSFTPTALNEFRFGYNRYHQDQYSLLSGTDYSTKYGYGNVAVSGYSDTMGFPDIFMGDGYLAGGSSYKPFHILDRNYQFGDSFTWSSVPRHEFKFGANLRLLNSHPEFSLFPTGYQYYGSFGNAETSAQAYWGYFYDAAGNWIVPNGYNWLGGSDIADLVLGLPLDVYMGLQLTDPHTHSWDLDFYAQDSFKVTPKLTLNYGVRYEYQDPWTEAHNSMSNFDLASGNIVLAGLNGVSNGIVKPRKNDFSPRFGFAYSIDQKTVVRAGGAIFYSPENDGREDFLTRNNPFAVQSSYSNWEWNVQPSNPQVWPYQIDAGAPRSTAINIPAAGFIEPKNLVNGTLKKTSAVNPNLKTGSTDSFNLAVERQLSRTDALDVAYVGSVSHHLSYKVGDINANPKQSKNAAGANTYDTRITPYLGAIEYLTDVGMSNYHSLQVKLMHTAKNASLMLSYTYGHNLDNGPAPFDLGQNNDQPQNPYNLRSEYATSDSDVRHNVVVSGEYNLPFGEGQTWGSNWNSIENAILAGWKFGGIVTMRTGTPVNVVLGEDPKSSLAGLRPNVTGNPNLTHSKRNVFEYFNTAAFSQPVLPPGASYVYGNAGRNLIVGPGFINVDASLAKEFAIEHYGKLQIRAEAFNGMNSVHYRNPDGNFQSPTFGMINSTMGDQRVAQLAAKFNF
ncbi:TonB-dependent receptor [Edaphobacter bradus]|uniref:TonB-dependent receptor n=1 Tax=Edaphobacter bradus TaxID=2259016 RepID=UPI0021E06E2A|nr:TonB-dependent receptor [Edaphobacter bradus]